jgi:transcriptional regulator with XRE-family HTH domain
MAERNELTLEEKKDREAFARRLTAVRNRMHLTQGELAQAIGYTDGFISMVEACKTRPGYDFFKNMIERFDVNPVYLLTGEGEMFLAEEKEYKIKGYEGPDKETVAKMLKYIEEATAVRFSVLEFFLNYIFNNENMVEAQRKEYLAQKKKKVDKSVGKKETGHEKEEKVRRKKEQKK